MMFGQKCLIVVIFALKLRDKLHMDHIAIVEDGCRK